MLSVRVNVPAYSHGELNDVKSIAQGTTSTVSTATLHGLTVAVKTLKPPAQIAEPLTRERAPEDFQNELFINAHLRHPNILLFIGCIRRTGLQSLVFEYCQGGSLKCASYGYARLLESLNVCIGVARALCFAHSLGILHRDVKPSQVLMQGDTPKLGDWGLACISRNGGCHSGETGTWEYMAPEVIRSEPYCTAVDVYSFAILTYCVVSGTAYPYEDRYITPAQAAMGVAKQDLRPNLSSRMPPALASIITSCWDKDANQRPNIVTVVDMLETARTVLANKKHAKVGNSWGAWLWG